MVVQAVLMELTKVHLEFFLPRACLPDRFGGYVLDGIFHVAARQSQAYKVNPFQVNDDD